MAMQNLFARAVGGNLPSAIPTALERIDQFAIGKVLTYQKKPRKLLPWRRHELNFTGCSITDLLAEGQLQELKFASSSEFLFDAGEGTDKLNVAVGLDGGLKSALAELNLELKAKEQKDLSISTDFGKITHIRTNLFEVLHAHRIRVNMSHPIVNEARKNGNTLFVIATLFQAEKCNITVSFSEKISDSAGVTAKGTASGVPVVEAAAGGSIKDSKSSVKVANRDQSTPLAYLLLRLVIHSNGELVPKLNNRLECGSDGTRVDMVDGPADWVDGGSSSKLTVPKINPEDSIAGEWVKVDMVRESKPEDSVKIDNTPQKTAEGSQDPSTVKETPTGSSLSVPSLNQEYVYSLKEFQCFASNTYEGVLKESRKWVCSVRANEPLKKAFLDYIKPPNSHKKLRTLSDYLQDYGSALRTGSTPPPVLSALEPLMTAMSSDPTTRLNENTALIVISEACHEFPQHVMQAIIELQPDKRELLLNIIKRTPDGVGRHVFQDKKPFNDPSLYPIMVHMGFSVPEDRLVYTSPEDVEDDILAAGIILIALVE